MSGGDPVLAEFFASNGCRPEPSIIKGTDFFASAFCRERLGGSMRRRIVDLSCGHKAVARNRNVMECPRCVEMLRQGFDYEAWLRGVSDDWPYDGMIWRKDPCRSFNEKTDLGGRFINDDEDPA